MIKKIKRRIQAFMTEFGFKQMSGGFYCIKNKILFGIVFEKPSSTVYINFFIWPLYMPCDCIYLTYGNRMNNVPYFNLSYLDADATENEFQAWCDSLCAIIEKYIFTHFDKVSTPEKLAVYLEKYSRKTRMMFTPAEYLSLLKLYTYKFIGSDNKANKELKRFKKIIDDDTRMLPRHRDRLLTEAKNLMSSDELFVWDELEFETEILGVKKK